MSRIIHVYVDASVQPQCTGLGMVVKDDAGRVIAWRNKAAPAMTSVEAEYAALIFGLEQALPYGADEVHVFSDSRVVVEQMCGWMTVRSGHLRRLHAQAHKLVALCRSVTLQHVPRDANQLADAIANEITSAATLVRAAPALTMVTSAE